MNTEIIRKRLVERGEQLFNDSKQLDKIKFTDEPQADVLLKDLDRHPHAFVLACVMDRQIKTERAWIGLSASDASVEQVIYRARALHPEFPGIMDLPCWEIGRNWCKARKPECTGCYLNDLCPTARADL